MRDGSTPVPGGRNRIQVLVDEIEGEVARPRAAGVTSRNEIVENAGGARALLDVPSGNPVAPFQRA